MDDARAAVKPPRHEHTVRRLETFSDIVIAFTLSQLAFTLKVPRASGDLLAHPIHIVTFVASFAFVCALWWLHHRLFARYFYPDTPSVLLNFTFLAATVFVAYSLLLVSTFGDDVSLGAYFASIGLAYSLLAVLIAKGLRDPRIQLDDADRNDGAQLARRIGIGGGGCLASALVALFGGSPREVMAVLAATLAATVFVAVRQRLARRRAQREAKEPVP
ncbi:MAG TPA: TMEM175 family protein [Candidatus Eremiobacteraceae bacterium]|nr:TMEM175 family protein [Candidatus Eremiobacteraceae bacterium]